MLENPCHVDSLSVFFLCVCVYSELLLLCSAQRVLSNQDETESRRPRSLVSTTTMKNLESQLISATTALAKIWTSRLTPSELQPVRTTWRQLLFELSGATGFTHIIRVRTSHNFSQRQFPPPLQGSDEVVR